MISIVEVTQVGKPIHHALLPLSALKLPSKPAARRVGISRRRSDAQGNSKLCPKCESLFNKSSQGSEAGTSDVDGSQTESTSSSHKSIPFHSLEKLAVEAVKGCHLCLQVYLGLDPEALKSFSRHSRSDAATGKAVDDPSASSSVLTNNDSSKGFAFFASRGKDHAKLSFIFTDFTVVDPEVSKPGQRVNLRVEFLLVGAHHPINHNVRLISKSSTSTASDESFDTARRWINECSKNHSKCSVSVDKRWKPTHLLDVTVRDFKNNPGVRLVDGMFVRPNSEYVTLSHCWGAAKAVRLHKGTLLALRQGIACTSLPKSLADAAMVAQKLGYQYIWIDALCIMHDDEQAVLREMAQMHWVYEYSALNIAATSASADSEGLFRSRNPDALVPGKIDVKGCEIEDGRYNILRWSTWHDMIDQSPLAKRAWVLQERALARRTLHYTRNELMWECGQHRCSETYSANLSCQTETPAMQLSESCTQHPSELANIQFNKELLLQQTFSWGQMVEMYSSKRLTYRSDRLMAISGLAQQHMKRHGLARTDYVAGLWRSELPRSLLWKVIKGRRSSKYRAPTWSWASTEGQVVCPTLQSSEAQSCVKVCSVDTKHKYGDNFGFCKDAELILSGVVARGLLPQQQDNKERTSCSLRFPTTTVTFDTVQFDQGQRSQSFVADEGKKIDSLEVYVLPVLRTLYTIQGLFLKVTPQAGHFQRVAVFELELDNESKNNTGDTKQPTDDGLTNIDLPWLTDSTRQTITLI